jgi:cysteine synthase A|tara:strand:- start:155 stop:1066 length:912 start_codon:yes stop_codon:yes gene_type:complete
MNIKLSDHIGKTPLIPITIGSLTVWGKAEFMNPSGSVKDRMASFIINDAEQKKLIKRNSTLCEATSGNSGISFAMLAAERGYKMVIIMPSNMSEERKKMFKYYGASLIEVDEGDFDGAIELRDNLCKRNGWFNCNQFHNKLNIEAHYKTTGPEIYEDWSLPKVRGSVRRTDSPSVFVAGTGTGGTLMGIGKYLKEHWPDINIVAVEPAESPVMSGGEPGLHGIQGIGDGSKFLVNLDFVDDIRMIKTECAKSMSKHLAKRYGLFIGISGGANVMSTFQWLRDNNKKEGITILCDRGNRYLSCL